MFRNTHKLNKNYLRVYANLNRIEYSEFEKEVLVDLYRNITNQLYHSAKLKYDIFGSGFGISKGGPLLGEKGFNTRLSKKGYGNLFGTYFYEEVKNFSSGFTLLTNRDSGNCVDSFFSWSYEEDKEVKKVEEIVSQISKYMDVQYGYAYSTDKRLIEAFESKTKNIFSVDSISINKSHRLWTNNLHKIEKGKIKELYQINLLSKVQRKQMEGIIPDEVKVFNDELQIWKFKTDKLKKMNGLAKNKVVQ